MESINPLPTPTPMTPSPTLRTSSRVPADPPFSRKNNHTPPPTRLENLFPSSDGAQPASTPPPLRGYSSKDCHEGVEHIHLFSDGSTTRTCDPNSEDLATTDFLSLNPQSDSSVDTNLPPTPTPVDADVCDASFNPASLQNLSKEEAAKILAEKGYTDEGKDKELKELFSDRPGSDNGNYSGSHAEPTRIVELLSLFSGIVFAGATGYSAYKTYETASKYLSPGWSRKTDRHSLEKRQQLGWDALKWGTGMTVSAALTLYTFLRR